MFWIGWFVISFIAGVIADNKGRSGIGVFLVSLVLSPLVGLIYALSMQNGEQREKSIAAKGGNSRDFRKCPYCAEPIRREATKCIHCSSAVEPAPYSSVITFKGGNLGAGGITQTKPTCPHCGVAIEANASACWNCERALHG